MSYSIHITRRSETGEQLDITLEEWKRIVESDPDFRSPDPDSPDCGKSIVYLGDTDHQWLWWVSGSISSDYPQTAMLKKMGKIARQLEAVITSDDGDTWTIDDEARVSIEGY